MITQYSKSNYGTNTDHIYKNKNKYRNKKIPENQQTLINTNIPEITRTY